MDVVEFGSYVHWTRDVYDRMSGIGQASPSGPLVPSQRCTRAKNVVYGLGKALVLACVQPRDR